MFEIFQDVQDRRGQATGGNVQRWCIAGVMVSFLFLDYIFTSCTMKFLSK